MSLLTASALAVYASWRSMNAYQSYRRNKGMTRGNVWDIGFSVLMCYWLILPSVLFLIAKVVDGLIALGMGIYLNMQVGPEKFLSARDRIVDGYWGYAITDTALCIACFFVSILGSFDG